MRLWKTMILIQKKRYEKVSYKKAFKGLRF
jgi:hypothetical protein